MGVYCVINNETQSRYLGTSKNIPGMFIDCVWSLVVVTVDAKILSRTGGNMVSHTNI